jgi:hypothetical protein
MKRARVFFLLSLLLVGCDEKPSTAPSTNGDPKIRVREQVGGTAGPLGGGRTREYEGPASKAPEWAQPAKTK